MNFTHEQLGLFSGSVDLLPGALQVAKAHQRAGQQHDNLCGPYWVSTLLDTYTGIKVDPTQIGQLAGAMLPIGDDPTAWVPPGSKSRQDYSRPLPTCPAELSGTAAAGLVKATVEASAGTYTLLPIQTRWTAERLETLMQICQSYDHWQAVPLANVLTGHFWGSRLGVEQAIAYLHGQPISPPPADWAVGHFVSLAGTIQGPGNTLLIVRDTYPGLGWDGYHLQPPAAIAAALNRDGAASDGGILLFIAVADQSEAETVFGNEGFSLALWDNGTPYSA
jgi:hypothetical protein